jgi:hypothetical protein
MTASFSQYAINFSFHLTLFNLLVETVSLRSRGSSLSIETRLRVQFPAGAVTDSILFATASRAALGFTQRLIHWAPGLFPRELSGQSVKLTTHLHPVPRLIMLGAIHPLPQYVFMAWCLVKHKDNFTFTVSKR